MMTGCSHFKGNIKIILKLFDENAVFLTYKMMLISKCKNVLAYDMDAFSNQELVKMETTRWQ